MTATIQNKEKIRSRITSLLHFSIRSGNAVIGQNRLLERKGAVLPLVLVNADASSNTVRTLKRSEGDDNVKVLDSDFDLGAEINKPGVKVIGLKPSELQKEIGELLKQYIEGNENER